MRLKVMGDDLADDIEASAARILAALLGGTVATEAQVRAEARVFAEA